MLTLLTHAAPKKQEACAFLFFCFFFQSEWLSAAAQCDVRKKRKKDLRLERRDSSSGRGLFSALTRTLAQTSVIIKPEEKCRHARVKSDSIYYSRKKKSQLVKQTNPHMHKLMCTHIAFARAEGWSRGARLLSCQ